MQTLKDKSVYYTSLILLLFATQSVSQIVQIDTIQEITTLDKKATIAIGNQLKEGSGYRLLFIEQQHLIDSLFSQISLQKQETAIYKSSIIPSLQALASEKDNEISFMLEKEELKDEQHRVQLKAKRKGNFWKGLGVGAIIAFLLTAFGG